MDLILEFVDMRACPRNVELSDGQADWDELPNQNEPWRFAYFQKPVKMAGHRFVIVRNQHAIEIGSQGQHIRVWH